MDRWACYLPPGMDRHHLLATMIDLPDAITMTEGVGIHMGILVGPDMTETEITTIADAEMTPHLVDVVLPRLEVDVALLHVSIERSVTEALSCCFFFFPSWLERKKGKNE